MRHLTEDVNSSDDLMKQTENDFKVKRWLYRDSDRHVYLNDIWHRDCCGRKDLCNIKNAIIAQKKTRKIISACLWYCKRFNRDDISRILCRVRRCRRLTTGKPSFGLLLRVCKQWHPIDYGVCSQLGRLELPPKHVLAPFDGPGAERPNRPQRKPPSTPHLLTRLMLDYFFGKKRSYTEAHRIEWACDKSVLYILNRLKSHPILGEKL